MKGHHRFIRFSAVLVLLKTTVIGLQSYNQGYVFLSYTRMRTGPVWPFLQADTALGRSDLTALIVELEGKSVGVFLRATQMFLHNLIWDIFVWTEDMDWAKQPTLPSLESKAAGEDNNIEVVRYKKKVKKNNVLRVCNTDLKKTQVS